MTDLKQVVRDSIDAASGDVVGLSHRIHGTPELAFEEERAAAWCTDLLADAGLTVEAGVAHLPTSFVATAGSGDVTIGICAEYDALPGMGHACGHNVIAAAALGAGMALAPIADDLGITVKVIGTPAEENGGGKILMLERGVFDGVHAAMMVHPGPAPTDSDVMPCFASQGLRVHYKGKPSHAGAAPWAGINAADAFTVAQTALGLLRQHVEPTARIHGIVTHGGDAPNIIPHDTTGKWGIRESTVERLEQLEPRVRKCFEAGAVATGATLTIKPSTPYSEMRDDVELRAIWRRNQEALGRTTREATCDPAKAGGGASTDMANISLALPSIHPMLGLDCLPNVNHQPEFEQFCATPTADEAALAGAAGMAWTIIDIASDPALRARLQSRQPVTEL